MSSSHQNKSKITEQELVSRLKKGDKRAIESWYRQYSPVLLRLTKMRVSIQNDVEDLVQETMINSLRQIRLFRQESSLKTWMITILRHEIADYYRKKYAKKAIKALPLGECLLTHTTQNSEQVQDSVRRVLGQMSGYSKKILLLKYVDGLRVKEIAKKMGKTLKSVEAELWRSRENFKNIYNKNELDGV